MGQQDLGYKRVFAHREMVADLLLGFVREPWVAEVEMDTLERVSGTYVSDDLREREDDIIWRVRWRGRWLYVYLLLEFQATVDSFMALRILVYVGLLYQDLIRDNKLTPDGRLPPVLPVVLYSGDDGWTAAREIGELIEAVPGGLEKYRPQMRYLLVEERGYPDSELAPMRNLAAALFRLENSRGPEDIIQVLETLIEWLQAPEQADLARALVVWLRRSLLASRMPDIDIPEIENLQEARTMLAERVKDWKKQWQDEARKEGEKVGRKEGESTVLLKQLARKFGAIDAEFQGRIAAADSEQLLAWAERILTSDNVDEVFG
jgi:hypothetical protein